MIGAQNASVTMIGTDHRDDRSSECERRPCTSSAFGRYAVGSMPVSSAKVFKARTASSRFVRLAVLLASAIAEARHKAKIKQARIIALKTNSRRQGVNSSANIYCITLHPRSHIPRTVAYRICDQTELTK